MTDSIKEKNISWYWPLVGRIIKPSHIEMVHLSVHWDFPRCDSKKQQVLINPHHQRFVTWGSRSRLLCRVQLLQQDARGVRHLSQQPTTRKPTKTKQVTLKWRTASTKHSPFHMFCVISVFGNFLRQKGHHLI